MFGKALGMGMARVPPVSKQSGAIFGDAPKEPSVFELGVFFQMDSVHEHG
jgi:hypothetical protein